MTAPQRRGGPATTAGKAISRMNATKHGALSDVIPQHEVVAYTQHLDLIRDHYCPQGYLEDVLTERVANLLWRIARVARYEQAVIKRQVDGALQRDGIASSQDVIDDLAILARSVDPDAAELLEHTRSYIQEKVALASLPVDLVDKVPRYEAHLDRSLQRALAQLKETKTMSSKFVSQNRDLDATSDSPGKGNG